MSVNPIPAAAIIVARIPRHQPGEKGQVSGGER